MRRFSTEMVGKVAVLASYNTGFVVYVDRLPVEGETLPGRNFRMEHGGKGSNQAIQAAKLGCRTSVVARLGNDIFAERALQKWRAENIDTKHVVRDSDAPTGVGVVIVGSEGRNMIVVDLGANKKLSKEDVSAAEQMLSESAVVLAQLEIPIETALYGLQISDAIKILNPAPAAQISPEQLRGLDIITPNEVEIMTMAGKPLNMSEIVQVAEKYAKYVDNVIVTLGSEGALVVGDRGNVHVKPPRIKAVDSTGAGDAFNGALAAALSRGYDLLEAVEYACFAGAFLTARFKGGELVDALPTEAELGKFISKHADSMMYVGKRASGR
ncbi:MAG: ribokinase [Candidatus Caldarchaeum sp.]